jgi:hypothetical protein
MIGKKCIVRCDRSGVFYGEVAEIEGQRCALRNFRKLHYWEGATAVEGLAMYGTKKPDTCRFTLAVDYGEVYDMIQCIPCTDESIKSIEGVQVWTI